jgi:hypothetical protein
MGARVGPLRPALAHSGYSFHDGLDLCFAQELALSDLPPPILKCRSATGHISAHAGEFKSRRPDVNSAEISASIASGSRVEPNSRGRQSSTKPRSG